MLSVALRSRLNMSMPWLSRLLSLAGVVVLIGLMPEIAGIDPAQSILRARAGAQQLMTPEALQSIQNDLQLNRSALQRLCDWLLLALQGDFGGSWVDGSSVSKSILQTAKTSLLLMISAFSFTLFMCAVSVLYTVKNWRSNRISGQYGGHNSLSSVLISLPEYVLASLLILAFAIWLGWFPPYGWEGIQNLWLPGFALALPATGLLSRLLNDSLKRVLGEPWVITWLSANVTQWQILRFALWRVISNLLPQIAMIMIGLTGGAVAVEQILFDSWNWTFNLRSREISRPSFIARWSINITGIFDAH